MQKRRILFICPYPTGQAPSQRFRFEQYTSRLEDAGFEFTIAPFLDTTTWQVLYQPRQYLKKAVGMLKGFASRTALMFTIHRFNYIFIHREAAPVGPPFFEFIAARLFNKRIIYDFDDAIWLPNTTGENAIISSLKWHSKVRSICRWSYRISCGNEFLARYARQFNRHVVVNPTTIDTENLHNPANAANFGDDGVTVGWTGTHSTLPYLQQLKQVLTTLKEKHGDQIHFLVIADRDPGLEIPSLRFMIWNKETEIDDLARFDIGIMPLPDDEWANGKCGFKALQYMALGIPAVVSNVGVNASIVEHGRSGMVCSTNEEWVNAISQLVLDTGLRKTMGANGRKRVVDHYSVVSNAANFLSLFQ